MKTISIITNRKVDKTFEGEECLLKRTIISTFKEKEYKRYVIKTERCNYVTEKVEVINEQEELIIENITTLKVIDKKDNESVRVFTFEQINGLYNLIKGQLPNNLTKMELENLEEQFALLLITKQDSPWSTNPSDWEIL